jgi:hypothetical protein
MNEIKEFKAWLERNPEIVKSHTLKEIETLALLAGFSPILVTQWKHHEIFKAAARS